MFFVNNKAHCASISVHVVAPSSSSPTTSGNSWCMEEPKLEARRGVRTGEEFPENQLNVLPVS